MADPHGKFCWFELMTSDSAAAQAFYTAVTGWQARDAGMPGMDYTMLGPPEHSVAGMMAITPEMAARGVSTGWTGYVAVDDVDAGAQQARQLGGQVLHPPEDIPGVGRFAVIADPQGAAIALFKDQGEGAAPAPPAAGTPGHWGWHELHAGELNAALTFYSQLFGWRKEETMDMGPSGSYQLLATGPGPADAAMLNKEPSAPHPYWLYYINVAGVDAALAAIQSGGGTVLHGPHQVPGGSWIVLGLDPQGAAFAVVGPRG